MADNVLEPYTFSFRDAKPASPGCSSRVWEFPTSILQSKIRVCGVQRSNESPSGAFKRQNGLRQQMEGPRPDKFADVYTSALLAGAMKPLNVLSKFENHFVIRTVRFQVQLEADGYFSAQEVFVFASAANRASWYQLTIFESDFTNPTSKTIVGLRPNPIFSTKLRRLCILTDAEQANFLRKNLFYENRR